MKKHITTEKLYSFLRGEERFRLYIEALCRGDEAEAKHLVESCPPEACEMNQAAYADRCQASREIVEMLRSFLDPPLTKLKTIEGFQKTLPNVFDFCFVAAFYAYFDGHKAGSRRTWAAAGMAGDPPGWRGQEEPEMDRELESLRRITSHLDATTGGFLSHLAELERELLKEVLTIWQAFANWCNQECGLEPEKLIKVWFAPMLPEIEKVNNLPNPPDVDPEKLSEYKEAFKEIWSELVERNQY
jgi:hypothetical protein